MAAATGGLGGVGVGILIADGRIAPLVAIPLFGLVLALLVRWIVPVDGRAQAAAVIALSFALHITVAVVLYTGSVAIGRGGFIPGDDAGYASLARSFVAYLQGHPNPSSIPPYWGGDAYLFGTWVYLESAIFLLIGPEVLVPIMLNGVFALTAALLVYDMAGRLFDRRSALVALVLTAFFPSLVLWSSLNLKDALAILLIGLCLWSLVRFQERPRWWTLALAFAVLVPMESLRRYLFVGLSLLIPMAVALTPRLRLAARARWTIPAVAVSAVLLSLTQTGVGLGPQLLEAFEGSRQAMGVGARTRFVDPPPQPVKEGDTFVAVGATPTAAPTTVHVDHDSRIVVLSGTAEPTTVPGIAFVRPGDLAVVGPPATTAAPSGVWIVISPSATPIQLRPERLPAEAAAPPLSVAVRDGTTFFVATPPPTIVHVPPDARIVVGPLSPGASVPPGVVLVQPGTVVVVGSPTTTAGPDSARKVISASALAVQLRTEQSSTESVALRTFMYMPTGLAHALFAPFPWAISRPVEAAIVPETLVWYAALVAAAVTLVRDRKRWQVLFIPGAFAVGVLLLLALVEGNVGTLYRHRAMALPWVLLLAAPSLVAVGRSFDRRSPFLFLVSRPIRAVDRDG